MYISLTPDPGYNLSFLKTCGIDGEFNLFRGSFSKDKDDLNGIVGDHHGQRINSFIDEFIDSSSKDTENLNGIAGDYHGQWIKAKDDRTKEKALDICLKIFGLRAEWMCRRFLTR